MLEQGLLAALLELRSKLEMGDLPQGFSGQKRFETALLYDEG